VYDFAVEPLILTTNRTDFVLNVYDFVLNVYDFVLNVYDFVLNVYDFAAEPLILLTPTGYC
jgi:hypothetical protein